MSFSSKRQSLNIHEKYMRNVCQYMRNRVKNCFSNVFLMFFICISHVLLVFCVFKNPNNYLILTNIHEIYMRYTCIIHEIIHEIYIIFMYISCNSYVLFTLLMYYSCNYSCISYVFLM